MLSILCKFILLLCGHALLVWYRNLLDLILCDHTQINELLLILEKLISDPVVALVEGSHEAGKYPQFLGPLLCDAKRLLSRFSCLLKHIEVLTHNQNASDHMASHI